MSNSKPYIVAEMSGNHNGSLDRALQLVDAAADAGADAIKIQTYTADTMTVDVKHPRFQISQGHDLWGGDYLYQLFERAHTPWDWHAPIFERARERGITPFSSPFDRTAVELLEKLDATMYKIASSEITDLPLIRLAASTGKPIIISTGMATLREITSAVEAAQGAGATDITVLSCTASYPAPPEETNLRRIPVLREALGLPIGLSDHTLGIGVPIAAVAFGAVLIEKHVTLDREDGGVDSAFSLNPAELASLVVESERAWQSLGTTRIGPTDAEKESLRFRRSLYVVADVVAGEPVTEANVRSIRPTGGLEPDEIGTVIGRVFKSDAAKGTPLTWDLV
ncbi:putative N-acetylneuraminic acid synthase [Actinoplanes missouriensis 431]|uniref:Putative N-acetylneuraminic acid synthase n=1 Tax=Actinoplanes missouriensis (strain ATCC 14538 / DSM 43046 / CBS 188.64 / JCM 3121 / NBRC 102363 / NCIMB 12654 / NRRL B-3342 / UNCC 431) TaxID=512565 RepID=I0GY26_ACTM4|nr:pseudaminic acid synthase [Actinoplanes missouriensis]BAL85663.1 putative N-acetylneuraminic acid synthase [Actinoplanes missouriensis 431]